MAGLIGVTSAAAQRAPTFSVGAGTAFPLSDIPEFYDPSAGGNLELAVPLSQQLDLTVGATYDRFFLDDRAFINVFDRASGGRLGALDLELEGGAYSVFSATTGLRWTVATPGTATLYLTGATGLFYETIHDLDVEAHDETGTPVEVSAGAEGNDTSYGFSLGAGVGVPVAAGVDFFVEPRYVLVLRETQYLPLRVGVSFGGLFGDGRFSAPAEGDQSAGGFGIGRYELSAAYQRAFFSDGDLGSQDFRASMAHHSFSDHTGLALGLSYRRAVDTEMRPGGIGGWSNRQSIDADLVFFVDVLRFTTGTATHRLRVGLGPALRHHWGEWPRTWIFARLEDQVNVDELLRSYDRVYEAYYDEGPQEGTHFLFTDTYEETNWGGVLNLQYNLVFDRLVAGPAAGLWRYGDENVLSYGLHLGVHF